MNKTKLFTLAGGLVLSAALTGLAQDVMTTKTTTTTTKTEVVQNPDGTYSVIEYPIGKEVVVDLTPNGDVGSARGTARVLRSVDGTSVNFDLNSLGEKTNYYAYAVDPSGAVTYLGPITSEGGTSKRSFPRR